MSEDRERYTKLGIISNRPPVFATGQASALSARELHQRGFLAAAGAKTERMTAWFGLDGYR